MRCALRAGRAALRPSALAPAVSVAAPPVPQRQLRPFSASPLLCDRGWDRDRPPPRDRDRDRDGGWDRDRDRGRDAPRRRRDSEEGDSDLDRAVGGAVDLDDDPPPRRPRDDGPPPRRRDDDEPPRHQRDDGRRPPRDDDRRPPRDQDRRYARDDERRPARDDDRGPPRDADRRPPRDSDREGDRPPPRRDDRRGEDRPPPRREEGRDGERRGRDAPARDDPYLSPRPLDPAIGEDRDFGPPKKFKDYTEERRDPPPPPPPRSRRLPQENEGVTDVVHGDGLRRLEVPEYKMWTAREGHVRRVLKARYGSHPGEMRDPSGAHRVWESAWQDVTPRIINQIRLDGSACFQVLNDLMGGDPNPGAEKVLEVIYVPGRPGVKFEQVHLRDKSLGHWAEDNMPPEKF